MVAYNQFSSENMQERLHMKSHPGTNPEPFKSTVAGIQEEFIILDESYCYPRGGGQPGDRGVFVVAPPLPVEDASQEEVQNFLERMMIGVHTEEFGEVLGGDLIRHPVQDTEYFSIGDEVVCYIDQEVRNQHARMHTAQHIVSALAEDLWGAETVGNQLTVESSRVDLLFEDKELFNPDELVDASNAIISTNRDVNIHQWERARILEHEQMRHTKFMHRIPTSINQLRVVEIEGVDLCPCAGSHVSNTSMVPKIKFQGKKNKGKGRIRFSYIFE